MRTNFEITNSSLEVLSPGKVMTVYTVSGAEFIAGVNSSGKVVDEDDKEVAIRPQDRLIVLGKVEPAEKMTGILTAFKSNVVCQLVLAVAELQADLVKVKGAIAFRQVR